MVDLQEALGLTSKELEQFRHICQDLLGHNFVLQTQFQKDGGKLYRNPDFIFIQRHIEVFSQYFALMDCQLMENHNGYFYLLRESSVNRLHLTKEQTALFLCLRLIYDEKITDIATEQDVTLSVQEILDKLIHEFELLKTYSKQKMKDDLAVAQHYRLVDKVRGAMNSAEAILVIYPSILTAVPADRIHEFVKNLNHGEHPEEDPS